MADFVQRRTVRPVAKGWQGNLLRRARGPDYGSRDSGEGQQLGTSEAPPSVWNTRRIFSSPTIFPCPLRRDPGREALRNYRPKSKQHTTNPDGELDRTIRLQMSASFL